MAWSVSCKRELLEWLLWHLGTGAGTAHMRPALPWVEGSWGRGAGSAARLSPWLPAWAGASHLPPWLRQELTFSAPGRERSCRFSFTTSVPSQRGTREECAPGGRQSAPEVSALLSFLSPALPMADSVFFHLGSSRSPHLPFSSASRAAEMSTLGFIHRLQPTQLLIMPKECNWQQQPGLEG